MFFKTWATIGTVELAGLEMTRMAALGADSAVAAAKSRTMLALMANKSSRVIPGFLGTPAGIKTMSVSFKALFNPSGSSGVNPLTTEFVGI